MDCTNMDKYEPPEYDLRGKHTDVQPSTSSSASASSSTSAARAHEEPTYPQVQKTNFDSVVTKFNEVATEKLEFEVIDPRTRRVLTTPITGDLLKYAALYRELWCPSIQELLARAKANYKLIEEASAMKRRGCAFVKLPDIIHGQLQETRFRLDRDSNNQLEPFYTQLVRSEADEYCAMLLDPVTRPSPFYLYGSVGIGKSYVLYQTACWLLLERDKCRVVYVNNANPGTIYQDYIMALASVCYGDSKGERAVLARLAPLFEDNKLDEVPIDEQIKAIRQCVSIIRKSGFYVISLIDQTNNMKAGIDREAFHFMTKTLQANTRCFYSGSANNEQPSAPFDKYSMLRLQVRISIEQMAQIIHQLFEDVAQQINMSASALELCYLASGGTMYEIFNFCRINAPGGVQQRLVRFRDDYQGRFTPQNHGDFLSKGDTNAKRSGMISALSSALFQKELIDKKCFIDQRFMFIEEEPKNSGRYYARFLTPFAKERVLPTYAWGALQLPSTNAVIPLLLNGELGNVAKGWLIEYYIIEQLKKNAESEQPFKFSVYSYPDRRLTNLTFSQYDVVRFSKKPSLEHASPNRDRLLVPFEADHPAFDFYYYAHKENIVLGIQITIHQDMDAKRREFDLKCPGAVALLRESFGQDISFYVIFMSLEYNSAHLIDMPTISHLNLAYLDYIRLDDGNLNEAIAAMVARNKEEEEKKKASAKMEKPQKASYKISDNDRRQLLRLSDP